MNDSDSKRCLIITKSMTVGDVAQQLDRPVGDVILYLLRQGIVSAKNKVLPEDLIKELARHYGICFEVKKEEHEIQSLAKVEEGAQSKRAPVIVVIGHVDHGKTTLLDYIRKTRVAQKEKGGITQHLGAYKVATAHGDVIFLDTPGHEAFMFMRERGVRVADVAVLVVAADDGVMPQTIEAIKHAQAAKVPIIVALNKIDKVNAKRIEEVKAQLSRHGLMIEEWGGDVICIPLSAKTGEGVEKLIETIPLFADLLNLKSRTVGNGIGYILESKMEKGRGAVSTIILQNGVIRVGDYIIAGGITGHVNALVNTIGNLVSEVGPSEPVLVAGFDALAQVGDIVRVVSVDEYKLARASEKSRHIESVISERKEGTVNILLKADTNSSKEALLLAIDKLAKEEQHDINIVQVGIGAITESDIMFAATTNAAIYGFCIKPEVHVQILAKKMHVPIYSFYVIYHLLDDLKTQIEKMRKPQMVEKKVGEAIVRKVFNIKGEIIAGCYVKTGRIVKGCKVIVWRGNQKIGEGVIQTLQREKRAVKEVTSGFECGFVVSGVSDFSEEDRIECFVEEVVVK